MRGLVFSGEKDGKPIVYVDDREASTDAVELLKGLGCDVKVGRLPVADFIVSERVGIEKKTSADFESSVIDGRLFTQAQELATNFERPFIIVVGEAFERLHRKAIRGALVSLMADFRIPVVFARDEDELAEFVYAVAEREQKRGRRETPLLLEKRAFTLAQKQRLIVESLPMTGPKTAKKLLEHFGSVLRIFGASEEELRKVGGVGESRAKEIRRIINSRYEKEGGPL
jgi:Fanconi anemia group M protein